MNTIILNFLMGILGFITYIVFTSFEEIKDKKYGLKQHFLENYVRWIWGVVMLSLIVFTLYLEPGIGELLDKAIGLDLISSTGSFWFAGITLAGFIKGVVKRNIQA